MQDGLIFKCLTVYRLKEKFTFNLLHIINCARLKLQSVCPSKTNSQPKALLFFHLWQIGGVFKTCLNTVIIFAIHFTASRGTKITPHL